MQTARTHQFSQATYRAFCLHRAQCPRPAGAGMCGRGKGAGWSPDGWTPTPRPPPTPTASLGSPSLDGHQRTSVKHWGSNQKVKQRKE